MADTCLVGCIKQYKEQCGKDLIKSINSHNISPFVRVRFVSDKAEITVGNESYNGEGRAKNSAVIKNFEYGLSTGHKCIIQIHDIEGGSFFQFIKKIVKNPGEVSQSGLRLEVKFGWVYSNCGTGLGGGVLSSSPTVYFLPDNVQANMSQGKLMFEIEGQEFLVPGEEFRCDKVMGEKNNEMHLVDAIKELFKNDPSPKDIKVSFKQLNNDGTAGDANADDLEWLVDSSVSGSGEKEKARLKGPKGVWACNGLTKKAAVEQWISSYRSKRGRGLILKWDGLSQQPHLIVWEDSKEKCGEPPSGSCVGTYLVNGGNCSPVIEFNPKFNWKWQYNAATGGIMDQGAVGFEKMPGRAECVEKAGEDVQAGTSTTSPTPDHAKENIGKDATKEVQKSLVAQQYANVMYGEELAANLVIQGDPRSEYCSTIAVEGKTIGIVVINPFNLFGSGNNTCPQFLAQPMCNAVLSNHAWRIRGINHYISEGKFITTLNVFLTVGVNTEY
jgi:hypothetical protein